MVGASWSRYLNKCSKCVQQVWWLLPVILSLTQEAEAGGSQGPRPGLHCEFKASLGYILRLCLKSTKTKPEHAKKASIHC